MGAPALVAGGVLPTLKKQANFLKGAPVFVSALVAPVLAGVTGATKKRKNRAVLGRFKCFLFCCKMVGGSLFAAVL